MRCASQASNGPNQLGVVRPSGEPSEGIYSDEFTGTLNNGWRYTLSSQVYTDPATAECFEGAGLPVDIYAPLFSKPSNADALAVPKTDGALDQVLDLAVRGPTQWTVIENADPNHLVMRCGALPGHQMALVTSDSVSFRPATGRGLGPAGAGAGWGHVAQTVAVHLK